MSEIWDLSTTDASNNDGSFGFPEGMNPSDVNDNLRRILGALARWYGDTNGSLVSGGTGSAYTLTSNRSLTTSYSDGQIFVFQANAASANGATLNVDSKGAKAILKRGTTTVSASDILANQVVVVAYETNNDKFQMLSPISGAGESFLKSTDIGSTVQAYDADILKADTADVLTAGFAATVYDAGTQSSGTYTPDEANGNMQKAVNGGAHTLAPPTNDCTLIIQYTNNGSAGAVTTSGFTLVDGDTITTTNGDDFFFYITKSGTFSHLAVKALQ